MPDKAPRPGTQLAPEIVEQPVTTFLGLPIVIRHTVETFSVRFGTGQRDVVSPPRAMIPAVRLVDPMAAAEAGPRRARGSPVAAPGVNSVISGIPTGIHF